MPIVKQVIYQYSPLAIQNLMISVYGYYWHNRRYGRIFEKELLNFKLREKFTYSEWENYQNEQLRSILAHAFHNVPLYKEKYTKYGIGPSDIKSFTIRDLFKLPPLEKEELRQFGTTKLLSTQREKGGIFLSSSGSTGTPTKILFSRNFHQKWQAAMEARVRNWAGITKDNPRGMIGGRRIIPSAYSKPPFYRYNFFEKQVYFSAYHISPSNLKGYISAFEKYPIDYMTGYAFSNYILAQIIANEGIKVPKLKAVITSSEKLTEGMRKTLEKVYNCKTYNSYSGVEACGLISENEFGELLISPDVGILEVLKPDGTPCMPGETGEIFSTGFLNYDQPLIRYRIGD
ncbi:MAG: phenylacetate--CoA ligase family protein, partial [Spirochaetes bacterium]|nr:phenylacetate--CoA ligase family protein [Spirochaetota bacterium]